MNRVFSLIIIQIFIAFICNAQYISTVAGGAVGYADGAANAAQFYNPSGLCADSFGNLYIADQYNQKIRKIDANNYVTTIAGANPGYVDGPIAQAKFSYPYSICIDTAQNLYVADYYNHKIRKITPLGNVTTLAGSSQGFANGNGVLAKFNYPTGVCADVLGNIYVSDRDNHKIRKITPLGVVSTLAGSTQGYLDATGAFAKFNTPLGVCVDTAGNVYVTDRYNDKIRKVTPTGVVSTFAGTTTGYTDSTGNAAQFNIPIGICVDAAGNVYVADSGNNKIRKITPTGYVTTLAGSTNGFADGDVSSAQFNIPYGVCVDATGNVFVADYSNHKIRVITEVTTSTKNIANADEVQIFPNPAKSILNIKTNFTLGNAVIIITDVVGKSITVENLTNITSFVDISKLSSGIYFATISSVNKSIVRKFVIE